MKKTVKVFPTLYKQGSKNEQQWVIEVFEDTEASCGRPDFEGDKEGVTNCLLPISGYTVRHGMVGGKQQEATTHIREGKNLGKANETSCLDQALSEAQSKWLKQCDKTYSTDRGGASQDRSPMLAHKYEDYKHQVNFPAEVQPKLDGVRCGAYKEGNAIVLKSRQGKEHVGLDHIRRELAEIFNDYENLQLDGELYVHGSEVNFQDLISLVKKDQEGSEQVQYHIYDVYGEGDFHTRFRDFCNDFAAISYNFKHVVIVPTHRVHNHEAIMDYHKHYTECGYEGVMLRHNGCKYTPGHRSRELLKVKLMQTEDFEIIGAKEGKGKREGLIGSFICAHNGRTFDSCPEGTDEQKREYWVNRDSYIGKKLTIRFFSWTDSEIPVPRFPVGVCVRDYE